MPRRGEFLLEGFRKGRPRDDGLRQERDVAARGGRGIEHDLEEVRGADEGRGAVGLDQFELRLGVARPRRNHRAAEGAGGGVEHEPARRQVIAEGVEHDVAGPQAGRVQRARPPPWIGLAALRLVDRPGRGEEPAEGARRPGDEAAEGRRSPCARPAGRTCAAPAAAPGPRDRRRPPDRARRGFAHRPGPSGRCAAHPAAAERDRPRGRPVPGSRERRKGRALGARGVCEVVKSCVVKS